METKIQKMQKQIDEIYDETINSKYISIHNKDEIIKAIKSGMYMDSDLKCTYHFNELVKYIFVIYIQQNERNWTVDESYKCLRTYRFIIHKDTSIDTKLQYLHKYLFPIITEKVKEVKIGDAIFLHGYTFARIISKVKGKNEVLCKMFDKKRIDYKYHIHEEDDKEEETFLNLKLKVPPKAKYYHYRLKEEEYLMTIPLLVSELYRYSICEEYNVDDTDY